MTAFAPVFLMVFPSLLIAFVVLVRLCVHSSVRRVAKAAWKTTLPCALLPGLLFWLLFFSLAVHMHSSLGKWPDQIGNHGFSPELNTHANVAFAYFSWFLLFAVFAWPILVALFAMIVKLRRFLPQVMALGLSFWLFAPWMFLAPSEFLYWWWD